MCIVQGSSKNLELYKKLKLVGLNLNENQTLVKLWFRWLGKMGQVKNLTSVSSDGWFSSVLGENLSEWKLKSLSSDDGWVADSKVKNGPSENFKQFELWVLVFFFVRGKPVRVKT